MVRNTHRTLNQISENKGKGETWGVMNCLSLTVQMQQITCTGWNMASSLWPSVLPRGGLGSPPCSITELTVGSCPFAALRWFLPCSADQKTLNQTPDFGQVSASPECGKVNWPGKFRWRFCYKMCHIISSFLFCVSRSINSDSLEQHKSSSPGWPLGFGNTVSITSWIFCDSQKIFSGRDTTGITKSG